MRTVAIDDSGTVGMGVDVLCGAFRQAKQVVWLLAVVFRLQVFV
jgi:hypothetical protein